MAWHAWHLVIRVVVVKVFPHMALQFLQPLGLNTQWSAPRASSKEGIPHRMQSNCGACLYGAELCWADASQAGKTAGECGCSNPSSSH